MVGRKNHGGDNFSFLSLMGNTLHYPVEKEKDRAEKKVTKSSQRLMGGSEYSLGLMGG